MPEKKPPQAPRDEHGKWLEGESGNPAGKPPGTRNRRTKERMQRIEEMRPMVDRVLTAVLEGRATYKNSDGREALVRPDTLEIVKLMAPRIYPPLRAVDLDSMTSRNGFAIYVQDRETGLSLLAALGNDDEWDDGIVLGPENNDEQETEE